MLTETAPTTAPRMHLSQSHLTLLEQCPRKFQQTYLDQVQTPMPLDQQQRLDWGNRFHLLMQQRELGLPLPPPASEEEIKLYDCMQQLVAAAPELSNAEQFNADDLASDRSATDTRNTPTTNTANTENTAADHQSPWLRQSEYRLTLADDDYLLTVVYDLLILYPNSGQILDWKTYQRPRDRNQLAQHWQTCLYLFVLAETQEIDPAQLSMTYWFTQPRPQCDRIVYSQAQHEQTRQRLQQLLLQVFGRHQHLYHLLPAFNIFF